MSVFEQVAQGDANTPANAWPVEITDGTNVLGTPTHPVKTDPTGTTTQPVSGTVAVSAVAGTVAVTESGPWTVTATQPTAANLNVTAAQPTAANLNATAAQGGTWTVRNDDGAGNALTSTSGALDSNLKTIGGTAPSTGTGASGAGIPRVTVSNDSAVKVWDGTDTLAIDSTGAVAANITEVGGSAMSVGQKTSSHSIPVVIASDQNLTVSVGAVYNNQTGACYSGLVSNSGDYVTEILNDDFTWSTLVINFVPGTGVNAPNSGGVFQVEGSIDNANWTPLTGTLLSSKPQQVTQYSTTGFALCVARYNLAGFPYVRINTVTPYYGVGVINIEYSFTTALGDETSFSKTELVDDAGNALVLPSVTQYADGAAPGVTTGVAALGLDHTGNEVHPLSVSSTGVLNTAIVGSVGISGSVAVTQDTMPWTVEDAADGAVGGTAPTLATLVGTKNPSGNLTALLADASGNLLVNVAAGSASNAAAGVTAVAVPADASYTGLNIAGNLVGQTGLALTNAKAAAVAIVDGGGNQITRFADTQYVDISSGESGTLAMGWAPSSPNIKALSVDASGSLNTNILNTPSVTVSGTATVSVSGTPTVIAKNQDGSGNNLTSTSGALNVNITGGSSSGTQYAAGAAVPTPTGTVALGWDGTDVRPISTNSAGVQNVAGTVAVTGSSGFSVDGAQNTAAPAHILQVGGVYNSTPPSVPTGDLTALQTDANGSLKVSLAGSSITPLVQIQSSGTNLTNTSGALNVNVTNNSNAGASATGSAVPASAEYTGFNSSGTLVGVSSTNPFPVAVLSGGTSGAQYTQGQLTGTGTLGTVVMGTYGTGSSTYALPLACDSNGTLLPAVKGAVTTTAPTYTTATNALLSLNTAGGLRVDGSGVTQPVNLQSSGTALTNTGGALNVNVTGGTSSGTQYPTGTAAVTPTGTVALGWDGTNVRALSTTTAGVQNTNLYVNGTANGTANPVAVSATNASNSVSNPLFVQAVIDDGAHFSALTATGTAPATATYSLPVAAVLYAGATPTAIGTPVAAGTGSLSGNALTCNSPLYVGTSPVSSSNPVWARLTDGANPLTAAISSLGTAPAGTEVMAVNAVHLPSAAAGAALLAKVLGGSTPQATAVNIKASAGNLYGLAITSSTATAGFVQFFNTATTATSGCVWAIPIAASGSVVIPPSAFALLNFSAGIAINVATPLNGTTTQIGWTGTVMYM